MSIAIVIMFVVITNIMELVMTSNRYHYYGYRHYHYHRLPIFDFEYKSLALESPFPLCLSSQLSSPMFVECRLNIPSHLVSIAKHIITVAI